MPPFLHVEKVFYALGEIRPVSQKVSLIGTEEYRTQKEPYALMHKALIFLLCVSTAE